MLALLLVAEHGVPTMFARLQMAGWAISETLHSHCAPMEWDRVDALPSFRE